MVFPRYVKKLRILHIFLSEKKQYDLFTFKCILLFFQARRQLAAGGCLSDQESLASLPRHSMNGGALTPSSGGLLSGHHGLGQLPGKPYVVTIFKETNCSGSEEMLNRFQPFRGYNMYPQARYP